MDENRVLQVARDVLKKEIDGLQSLRRSIGKGLVDAVHLIRSRDGTVVVTGIGKSGLVGKKISATLTSVGTPSLFIHPTDSLHGDLGILSGNDVVLALSKSGESDEFMALLPYLKRREIPIIAMTASPGSELARNAEVVLDINTKQEACLHDAAPTVSTTVMMALGDALAAILMECRDFRLEDFAALHPGGTIGKRYWLRVEDMMLRGESNVPAVSLSSGMKEVIMEMTSKRGITSVVDGEGRVVGVFTDGDLRRLLEREEDIFRHQAGEVMNSSPKLVEPRVLAVEAAARMERYGITALIVVDSEKRPVGILHLHDLMRARVV
jgi:arabinose-5-phosphate isomerase